MYLIEIIPISRGIAKDTLSYFSSGAIPIGSLVTVPLRKKQIHGLVVSSRDAREAKSEIRSSDFVIKKVGEFKSENFLSEAFMKAAKASADYFVGSLGSVLRALVPRLFFEEVVREHGSEEREPRENGFDRLILQADEDDRFASYRSLIREEFARKRSVFFCLPTGEDVKRAGKILPKGIEQYTYLFYGSLPSKKFKESLRAALSETHPVLIIATGLFFSIRRSDFGSIVVENESSRYYKMQTRPFLDVRLFAEYFAKESGAKFVIGDTLSRTESLFRFKEGEFAEFSPVKFRSLSPARFELVDMRLVKKNARGGFQAISEELREAINGSQMKNQHMFIFTARRGLASQTVCGDCGSVVTCGKCRVPVVLHAPSDGKPKDNFFLCHACGERRSAEERCLTCTSWKLKTLGVGIELIEQELRQQFPELKIFRVDKDSAPVPKRAEKAVESFYASPGSVLLGTEMVLPYLDRKVDNTAVASLDSLFSLPDFRIHEKIFHLLLKIRAVTLSSFLIQTRMPEEHIVEYALKGNLLDFYREEIVAREKFYYPPFTNLIKISLSGTKPAVAKEMSKLPQLFLPLEMEIFPAFAEAVRGKYTMHALLRLPRKTWIDRGLLQKLLTLPPEFRVEVDPESLL